MRLGQLARKVDKSPAEIVDFLSQKGVIIKNHPNVKLEESVEKEVLKTFLPDEDAKPVTVEISEDLKEEPFSEINGSAQKKETEDPPIEKELAEETIEYTELKDSEFDELENEPELIKAPKVELPGLKVVGKIDLPEPKIKESETKEEEKSDPEKEKESGDTIQYVFHNRKNSRKRLSPEEREAMRLKNKKAKEKRIQREEERREQEEKRQLKAKKTEFYKKKIVQPPSQKPIKTNKKQDYQEERQVNVAQPKTLFGKFWHWLNT